MAAAYVETVQMLNSDAARKQEAAQVAALEALRLETSKRSERVKALKAKSMLISAENVSKQELVDSMSVRLEEMSKELSRMALLQAKDQMAKKAEDEKAVALQVIFEKTLDQAVSSSTGSTSVHSELFAAYAAQTGPRHTLVYFCPDGQTREEAVDTTSIRLGRTTTFREITVNVARFFGLPYDVALLEDENNTIWPLDVVVGREITRYRGDQTIRLVRRDDAAEHREARASHLDDENDAEEMGAGQLLKALGGPRAQVAQQEVVVAATEQVVAVATARRMMRPRRSSRRRWRPLQQWATRNRILMTTPTSARSTWSRRLTTDARSRI